MHRVNYDQSSGEADNQSEIEQIIRKRGRPRMSRTSILIARELISSGYSGDLFRKQDQFDEEMKHIEHDISEAYSEAGPKVMVFKLKESMESQDRAAEYLGLMNRELQNLRSEFKKDRKATKFDDGNNMLAALLGNEIYDKVSRDEYMYLKRNSQQVQTVDSKKLLQLKIIHLKATRNARNVEIARACYCSESKVSRTLRDYKASREAFIEKLKSKSVLDQTLVNKIRDKLRNDIIEGRVMIRNTAQLRNYLVNITAGQTTLPGSRLLSILRKELPLAKYKPRHKCPISRGPLWYTGQELAHKAVLYHFGITKKMLIFDSTCFVLDHKGVNLWSLKGLRPTVRLASSPQYLYMHTMISSRGLVGIVLEKNHGSKSSINYAIYKLLERARMDDCSNSGRLILYLDNSPLHDSQLLSKTAGRFGVDLLYNVPSNPVSNPIEVFFGALKQVFKNVAMDRCYLHPETLLETILGFSDEKIVATNAYTLNNIN